MGIEPAAEWAVKPTVDTIELPQHRSNHALTGRQESIGRKQLSGNPLVVFDMHAAVDSSILLWLTSPLVSGVLLTLGLLGLLLEMQTLHGIAGAVGLGALGVFFGGHIAAGDAGAWILLIALLGLVGIFFELHVVPGHGHPGVLGACVLAVSVLLAFGTGAIVLAGQTLASALVATVLLFVLATRVFPENAWVRRLSFAAAQGTDYVASGDYRYLLGRTGEAVSLLRPAGIAAIGDQRVDVLTAGAFLPAGTPVRVTRVEGARIFVEKVDA